jgi:hypothetical protein
MVALPDAHKMTRTPTRQLFPLQRANAALVSTMEPLRASRRCRACIAFAARSGVGFFRLAP